MLKHLKQLSFRALKDKHPNVPEYALPIPKYSDKTANGLTRCIIDWIQYNGGQAERISNTGRYIDGKKSVTDSMGFGKTIGSGKYIPGTGTNGTADISATIKGRSVKIEVKMKDRQSDAQKKYQEDIERAGGIYLLVRSFNEFYEKYQDLIK